MPHMMHWTCDAAHAWHIIYIPYRCACRHDTTNACHIPHMTLYMPTYTLLMTNHAMPVPWTCAKWPQHMPIALLCPTHAITHPPSTTWSPLVKYPSISTYCARKMLFHNSSSIKSCNTTTVIFFKMFIILLDPLLALLHFNNMPTHCTDTLCLSLDSSPPHHLPIKPHFTLGDTFTVQVSQLLAFLH